MQLKCLQNKLQKCEMALIFVKAFYFIMFTKIPLCRSWTASCPPSKVGPLGVCVGEWDLGLYTKQTWDIEHFYFFAKSC